MPAVTPILHERIYEGGVSMELIVLSNPADEAYCYTIFDTISHVIQGEFGVEAVPAGAVTPSLAVAGNTITILDPRIAATSRTCFLVFGR